MLQGQACSEHSAHLWSCDLNWKAAPTFPLRHPWILVIPSIQVSPSASPQWSIESSPLLSFIPSVITPPWILYSIVTVLMVLIVQFDPPSQSFWPRFWTSVPDGQPLFVFILNTARLIGVAGVWICLIPVGIGASTSIAVVA
ncbi:hypothetical protein BC827DRAFT_870855 [Russula dissimulans]|nr:hypothetical protein BC827DRAFT_870855 [Russula dissimulans]